MDSTTLRTPKIPQHVLQEDSKSQTSINFRTYLPSKPSATPPSSTSTAKGNYSSHRKSCQRHACWCAVQSWCVLFAGSIGQKTSKNTHFLRRDPVFFNHLKGKHGKTPVLGYPFHRNCLQLECNYWTENGEVEQGHWMELMIYNCEKETKAKQPANLQYT